MKVELTREAPIDGIMHAAGETIEVANDLGARLIDFRFARMPGRRRDPEKQPDLAPAKKGSKGGKGRTAEEDLSALKTPESEKAE